MTLRDAVADTAIREELTHEAVAEAGAAIAEIGGLRGQLVSMGFDAARQARPGFLEAQIFALLPEWAEAIDPFWQDGVASGDPEGHLVRHAPAVAEAMLTVTDTQAAHATDRSVKAVYDRLRPNASTRVAEHMPRLAAFVARHSDTGQRSNPDARS